jgi:hypothetical protein
MSASDGYVGGTTKVVDHGPEGSRWNLVIVGDGYRATELAKYHTDVQTFVDRMYTTPPFDELWCGINIYRVDVVSNESGADDPTTCAGGTGASPRTYFDSTYCTPWGTGHLERLMSCDSTLAMNTAKAAVAGVHQVLVIVNSSKYGGGGGTVAICSTTSPEIAIHEMGHSAFGLADEYEGTSAAPASEPAKPNVTLDTNRATNKWRDLVAGTTPMPSSCYADCPTCTPPATPPAANAVGTYEGGLYAHCGVFRPLPGCYMRDYSPFCPVCARVIRQTLQSFLPAESISLSTPSISFTDIPEGIGSTGVTTYRAIVWNVTACRNLTFQITAGPSGGFGTPLGTSVTVPPAKMTPAGYARLWISYTSGAAGSTSSGSVTVRCNETSQSWTININANTVARPKSAVALVLDRSGSMSEGAGDGKTKVEKLREAARIFVDVMLPGDAVGIVRFNHAAQRLMDVTDVGAVSTGAGRATAKGHINGSGLDPSGATSIGDGVVKGKKALDDAQAIASPPYDVRAMVVLTDGQENTAPMLSSVGTSITANTFAIGLGLPYNISTAALNALTQGHNGYLLITGQLTLSQTNLLTKYFLQILAGISNANVIVDPRGELSRSAEHRIPFTVGETEMGIEAILLTPVPYAVEYLLETPDGTLIDPATAAALGTTTYVIESGVAFYRASLPAVPAAAGGSHEGTWHAILRLAGEGKDLESYVSDMPGLAKNDPLRRGILPYDFLVHCYSNLAFRAGAYQTGYEPGATVDLTATLREYDVPVEGRARVWAEVTHPNGSQHRVDLAENNPGDFCASFVASHTGVYAIRVRALGETFKGLPFVREQSLTAAVYPGGDRHLEPREPDALCRLVDCLQRRGIDSKLAERLAAEGIDLKELLDCLAASCTSPAAQAERERATQERKDSA